MGVLETPLFPESGLRHVAWHASDALTNTALMASTNTKPIAPARMSLDNAKELIALPHGYDTVLKLNRRLYYGDHWLNGEGWRGPWPMAPEGATNDETALVMEMQNEIVRGFTSRNAFAEAVDRHNTGCVGIEPKWTWTPDGIRVRAPRALRRPMAMPPAPVRTPTPSGTTPPTKAAGLTPEQITAEAERERQRARIELLNSQLTRWWDDRNAPQVFQSFGRSLLYGRVSTLRLYIPSSAFTKEFSQPSDETGERTPTGRLLLNVRDVEDAFSKIHIEVVDPDDGRVVRERTTMQEIGVRLVPRGDERIAHATYVDDTGRTVLAVIDNNTANSTEATGTTATTQNARVVSFDLGGRLLMHTAVRDAFITEQVRQAQYALNYATSIIPRNLTTAGFRERVLANINLPGITRRNPDGSTEFIPTPIMRGPHVTNVFQGTKLEDASGNQSQSTPIIHDTEPVDPAPTIRAKREHYEDILAETDQLHVLIAGDATASGISREHARADHLASMGLTRAAVERAGRWLLETVTAWAYALADPNGNGGADAVKGLRVSFSCYLDAGPLSPDERAQNTADVGAGTLSVETAIERNNVPDVDAELERIDNSRAMDLEVKRAEIFGAWVTAGADEAYAGWRAGLSPEEVARMVEGFEPPPEPIAPNSGNNDGGGNGGGNPGDTGNTDGGQ